MALCTIEFVGESLRKDTAMKVVLPQKGRGPFPVLYVLHGLSHDHSYWQRDTNIHKHVAALPLIVVMPEGQRSFYCNDPRPDGLAYEDHIVKDVVGLVDRMFPTIRHRSARAIAGMSMGGYGAMMLGLRPPDLFSVIGSQAGALHFTHDLRREAPPGVQYLAETLPRNEYDCYALARRVAKGRNRRAIRMGCGYEDRLLDVNRDFHRHLEKLGIAHEFVESPGQHNTRFWEDDLEPMLEFVMRCLQGRRKPRGKNH